MFRLSKIEIGRKDLGGAGGAVGAFRREAKVIIRALLHPTIIVAPQQERTRVGTSHIHACTLK